MTIQQLKTKINQLEEIRSEHYYTIKVSNDPDIIAKATDKVQKVEYTLSNLRYMRENLHYQD